MLHEVYWIEFKPEVLWNLARSVNYT